MMIKRALICANEQKTDDELKAIMATHPWADALLLHGFYKRETLCVKWKELASSVGNDAIWIDVGIAAYASNDKWIAESFNAPEPALRPLPDDINDAWWQRWHLLRRAWWDATSNLILSHLPDEYQVYVVYYGEIEDDFDCDGTQGGDVAVAEAAWRDGILARFNYDPEVEAALGQAMNDA